MYATCHRCHADLPRPVAATGSTYSALSPEAMLFCPHCSAPQILLPEHMRPLAPARGVQQAGNQTTGSAPPPHPRFIEWPAALRSAAIVAGFGALLKVLALVAPPLALVATPWVAGCSILALGLYMRQRPGAFMDARTGLRIGAATGILMVAALGIAFAASGMVARFALHRMLGFDNELSRQLELMRAQMAVALTQQNQPADLTSAILGFVASPEVRGGLGLAYLGISGFIVMLLATAGGALSGMLRVRREAPSSAD